MNAALIALSHEIHDAGFATPSELVHNAAFSTESSRISARAYLHTAARDMERAAASFPRHYDARIAASLAARCRELAG